MQKLWFSCDRVFLVDRAIRCVDRFFKAMSLWILWWKQGLERLVFARNGHCTCCCRMLSMIAASSGCRIRERLSEERVQSRNWNSKFYWARGPISTSIPMSRLAQAQTMSNRPANLGVVDYRSGRRKREDGKLCVLRQDKHGALRT